MDRFSLSSVLFVVTTSALVVNFFSIYSTNSIIVSAELIVTNSNTNNKVNQEDHHDNHVIVSEKVVYHQANVKQKDVDEALIHVKRSPDPKGKGGFGSGNARYPSWSRRGTGKGGGKLSASQPVLELFLHVSVERSLFIGICVCYYAKRNF